MPSLIVLLTFLLACSLVVVAEESVHGAEENIIKKCQKGSKIFLRGLQCGGVHISPFQGSRQHQLIAGSLWYILAICDASSITANHHDQRAYQESLRSNDLWGELCSPARSI